MIKILIIALVPIIFTPGPENKTVTKTYTIDDQQVIVAIEAFTPPILVKKELSKMNQASAMNCSLLFYSFLSKGDINSAATLSNDPAKVKDKYVRQKERAGETEFKKMYADYFEGKALIKYHFSLEKSHMLIVHSEDMGMDMAQFYIEESGKFFVDEREGAEKDRLAKIFQQLKDEQGNVSVQ